MRFCMKRSINHVRFGGKQSIIYSGDYSSSYMVVKHYHARRSGIIVIILHLGTETVATTPIRLSDCPAFPNLGSTMILQKDNVYYRLLGSWNFEYVRTSRDRHSIPDVIPVCMLFGTLARLCVNNWAMEGLTWADRHGQAENTFDSRGPPDDVRKTGAHMTETTYPTGQNQETTRVTQGWSLPLPICLWRPGLPSMHGNPLLHEPPILAVFGRAKAHFLPLWSSHYDGPQSVVGFEADNEI